MPNGDQISPNGKRLIGTNTGVSFAILLSVVASAFIGGQELGDVKRGQADLRRDVDRRFENVNRKQDRMDSKIERLLIQTGDRKGE